jgi:hypothetical protein
MIIDIKDLRRLAINNPKYAEEYLLALQKIKALSMGETEVLNSLLNTSKGK